MSVYGTGRRWLRRRLRVFSGACSSVTVSRPEGLEYFQVSPSPLPPESMATSLQRAIRSARGPFASPSPCLLHGTGLRNIDRISIHLSLRDGVRPRLTLNRLALFRNPWSSGEGVSRPLCRYLCLHLLFRRLHRPSRTGFADTGMLPYRYNIILYPTSSAPDLCPIIIHAGPLD